MGLHVFFGCYHNLFRLMTKCGVLDNLLVKEHVHTFVNEGTHLHLTCGACKFPACMRWLITDWSSRCPSSCSKLPAQSSIVGFILWQHTAVPRPVKASTCTATDTLSELSHQVSPRPG